MTEIELYSARLCPFAHRSRLTLVEKQLPFTLIEIDLQHKPANFREISPSGQIPVLKVGGQRVWESAIINEYLDEAFPDPPLLPKAPLERAQARMWIEFANGQLFAPTHRLLLTQPPPQQVAIVEELVESLRWIEQQGLPTLSAAGPYWLGAAVSLVDFTYYPWFEQVAVLQQFRGFEFPPGLDRLNQWRTAVAERESVRSIARTAEFYLGHYGQLLSPPWPPPPVEP